MQRTLPRSFCPVCSSAGAVEKGVCQICFEEFDENEQAAVMELRRRSLDDAERRSPRSAAVP